MPWTNAATFPPVCSQISRPSRARWPGDRVRVIELVGRVRAGLARELGGALDHVRDVLRRDAAALLEGRQQLQLRPERAGQPDPLLAEAFGDDNLRGIALRAADERERRPGAAAGVLDHRRARLEQAVPLGALDHRERHPVLHRAGRVAVLELDPDLGALGRDSPQPDERGVADRVEDPAILGRPYSRPLSRRILRYEASSVARPMRPRCAARSRAV
jgi:hypothetical protein